MKSSPQIGRRLLCLWGAFSGTRRKVSQDGTSALLSTSGSIQAQERPPPTSAYSQTPKVVSRFS